MKCVGGGGETLSYTDMKRVKSINQDYLFHINHFFFQLGIMVTVISRERSDTKTNKQTKIFST